MTDARPFIAGAAALLVCVSPPDVVAQEVSDRDGLYSSLTEAIALEWERAPEQIRVELEGSIPEGADSLTMVPGSRDRWIVSVWIETEVTRRFARAGVVESVPVASRDLPRGTEVAEEDVTFADVVVWGAPRGPAADPVGLVAERLVSAGEPLVHPSVRPPLLVSGGDEVEALFEQPGVVMRVRAEALASAREGDRIFVRLASGKRMSARALERGVVELLVGGS